MKKYIQLKDTWSTKAGDEWVSLQSSTLYAHIGTSTLAKEDVLKSHPEWFKEVTEPKPSFKKWRAEEGGKYWVVAGGGEICCNTQCGDKYDNYYYLTGNYFQTKQEAEAYKARQEAIGRVTHAIMEANEGWEPDWENPAQWKSTIKYDHASKQYQVYRRSWLHVLINIPWCKNDKITLSIISSHKEDLDLIFNVKK